MTKTLPQGLMLQDNVMSDPIVGAIMYHLVEKCKGVAAWLSVSKFLMSESVSFK